MKAREVKRQRMAAQYAEKRAALKSIIAHANMNDEDSLVAAYEAARKLQSIPRNANPIRQHNRCMITGRPKGYVSSASAVYSSERWPRKASFPALRRQVGKQHSY